MRLPCRRGLPNSFHCLRSRLLSRDEQKRYSYQGVLSSNYGLADFPTVAAQAPKGQDLTVFQESATYDKAHPYRIAILMTGLVLVAMMPVLGAVGFEALGHGAGTAASSWQASIGLVEASGFYA